MGFIARPRWVRGFYCTSTGRKESILCELSPGTWPGTEAWEKYDAKGKKDWVENIIQEEVDCANADYDRKSEEGTLERGDKRIYDPDADGGRLMSIKIGGHDQGGAGGPGAGIHLSGPGG